MKPRRFVLRFSLQRRYPLVDLAGHGDIDGFDPHDVTTT
jgi:hypothetical protein